MSKKPYYIFYPSPILEEPKDPSKFLSDLGRATKRGIRKCYKCGTYNGTRGLLCKNKQCDAVFKDCAEKQANLDAIKLISGKSRQVFSVRVRDKGPDCRGFVQLPLMHGSNQANEKNVALSEVALCFVDSCQRLFDDSILKCHEADQNKVTPICIHIKSALKSVNVAVTIETKSCILNSLNFDEDVKHKLWLLSSKTEGALVQRVSKTVMAVKCQVTPKHPLGYLHFTFCVTKARVAYDKFYCSCFNFKGHSCLNDNLGVFNQKCIHFYACVWAFASDLKFTEEFIDFLNLVLCTGNDFQTTIRSSKSLKNNMERNLMSHCLNPNLKKCKNLKRKSNMLNMIYMNRTKLKPKAHTRLAIKPNTPEPKKQMNINLADDQSLSFIDWLTSITEKINQTLRCKQSECMETLNFYIPLKFYQLLEDRLRNNGKQLNHADVNSGTTDVSYLIYSIPHLKTIFDTPQVSLQIVALFLQNNQGVKIVIEQQESVSQSHMEYKQLVTYLRVGMAKNEDSCIPFTINWNANVLPISNFGKLELTFHIGCCDAVQFNNFS